MKNLINSTKFIIFKSISNDQSCYYDCVIVSIIIHLEGNILKEINCFNKCTTS